MNKTPIFEILKHRFNLSEFSIWYLVGSLVGVAAWLWGKSSLSVFALKLTSGVGWFVVLITAFLAILGLVAFLAKPNLRALAIGDFRNFFSCVYSTTLRASSVLLGVSSIAGICWVATGSANAMGTTLNGFLLCLAFLWFWVCLSVLDDAIEALSD